MPQTCQQQAAAAAAAGTEVWCARMVRDLPCHQMAPLSSEIFASYSGPDGGLEIVPSLPVVPPPPPECDQDAACDNGVDRPATGASGQRPAECRPASVSRPASDGNSANKSDASETPCVSPDASNAVEGDAGSNHVGKDVAANENNGAKKSGASVVPCVSPDTTNAVNGDIGSSPPSKEFTTNDENDEKKTGVGVVPCVRPDTNNAVNGDIGSSPPSKEFTTSDENGAKKTGASVMPCVSPDTTNAVNGDIGSSPASKEFTTNDENDEKKTGASVEPCISPDTTNAVNSDEFTTSDENGAKNTGASVVPCVSPDATNTVNGDIGSSPPSNEFTTSDENGAKKTCANVVPCIRPSLLDGDAGVRSLDAVDGGMTSGVRCLNGDDKLPAPSLQSTDIVDKNGDDRSSDAPLATDDGEVRVDDPAGARGSSGAETATDDEARDDPGSPSTDSNDADSPSSHRINGEGVTDIDSCSSGHDEALASATNPRPLSETRTPVETLRRDSSSGVTEGGDSLVKGDAADSATPSGAVKMEADAASGPLAVSRGTEGRASASEREDTAKRKVSVGEDLPDAEADSRRDARQTSAEAEPNGTEADSGDVSRPAADGEPDDAEKNGADEAGSAAGSETDENSAKKSGVSVTPCSRPDRSDDTQEDLVSKTESTEMLVDAGSTGKDVDLSARRDDQSETGTCPSNVDVEESETDGSVSKDGDAEPARDDESATDIIQCRVEVSGLSTTDAVVVDEGHTSDDDALEGGELPSDSAELGVGGTGKSPPGDCGDLPADEVETEKVRTDVSNGEVVGEPATGIILMEEVEESRVREGEGDGEGDEGGDAVDGDGPACCGSEEMLSMAARTVCSKIHAAFQSSGEQEDEEEEDEQEEGEDGEDKEEGEEEGGQPDSRPCNGADEDFTSRPCNEGDEVFASRPCNEGDKDFVSQPCNGAGDDFASRPRNIGDARLNGEEPLSKCEAGGILEATGADLQEPPVEEPKVAGRDKSGVAPPAVITIYRTQPAKRKHAADAGLSPPSGKPRLTGKNEKPATAKNNSHRARTSPGRSTKVAAATTVAARSRTSPGRAQTEAPMAPARMRRAKLAEPEDDLDDDDDTEDDAEDVDAGGAGVTRVRLRPKFSEGRRLRGAGHSRLITLTPDAISAVVMKPRLADAAPIVAETRLRSNAVRRPTADRIPVSPPPPGGATERPARAGRGIIDAAKSRVAGRKKAKPAEKPPPSTNANAADWLPLSPPNSPRASPPTSPFKFAPSGANRLAPKSTAKSAETNSPPKSPPPKLGGGLTVDMAKAQMKAKKAARRVNRTKRPVAPPVAEPCVAGAPGWNAKSRKAYGISMSLYDEHPITRKISGEPIADSFAVCARQNNALLVVADGVNWGRQSMLASRCAVHGCVSYVNEHLFRDDKRVTDTHAALSLLLHSLDAAHAEIMRRGAGLTTICAALVVPLRAAPGTAAAGRRYAVCVVAVGDSLAFVRSRRHGVREVTAGSRDLDVARDIRNAGGALGPVHGGRDPELQNLTCAITLVDAGDIVFLTSDGVSDNFDPVVAGSAVAVKKPAPPETRAPKEDEPKGDSTANGAATCGTTTTTSSAPSDANRSGNESSGRASSSADGTGATPADGGAAGGGPGKPPLSPRARHRGGVAAMANAVENFEQVSEQSCSAQEVCATLLQTALRGTAARRAVLEDPALYGRAMRARRRRELQAAVAGRLAAAGGKLDHATVVAYEVGRYRGDDVTDVDDDVMDDATPTADAVRQHESNV